ncbi:hypothetical protein K3495_g9249 [Podosphaera aphanis]|nr:hypothetical protein K3495_g9249 [Podosphaera aphanis]
MFAQLCEEREENVDYSQHEETAAKEEEALLGRSRNRGRVGYPDRNSTRRLPLHA